MTSKCCTAAVPSILSQNKCTLDLSRPFKIKVFHLLTLIPGENKNDTGKNTDNMRIFSKHWPSEPMLSQSRDVSLFVCPLFCYFFLGLSSALRSGAYHHWPWHYHPRYHPRTTIRALPSALSSALPSAHYHLSTTR